MVSGKLLRHKWLTALLAYPILVSVVFAQTAPDPKADQKTDQKKGIISKIRDAREASVAAKANESPAPKAPVAPPARQPEMVAERSDVASRPVPTAPDIANPNEHPLMPALRWAYDGIGNVEKIEDYSATLAKQERIGGKLADYEYMFIKMRHRPFSVYMNFLAPAGLKGQEVMFIEGKNEGKMWAHGVGVQAVFGTVSLEPTSVIAMKNQHYPLTELGILNMVRRLVEVGETDRHYGECEVNFIKNAKVNDRVCTCIQVTHPVPRRNFLFHLARIFVDDELNLPIRYESYDWPKEAGGPPELIEQYTYLNLKINNGFTDGDFDVKNPNYKFPSK
jgi:hypothetical protein